MIQAEDKTYENEINSQENQLKNIIDMKEVEITAYQQKQTDLYVEIKKLRAEVQKLRKENDNLTIFKIKAVEEAKKEADKLMIEKIIKYEKEIRKLKKEAKDMLLYP